MSVIYLIVERLIRVVHFEIEKKVQDIRLKVTSGNHWALDLDLGLINHSKRTQRTLPIEELGLFFSKFSSTTGFLIARAGKLLECPTTFFSNVSLSNPK